MNFDDLVLGVDGGGTKTVAWLSRVSGAAAETIGRGAAGPSNPGVVGMSQAIATLAQAIDAAFDNAGLGPGLLPAACLAVSGSERTAHRDAMLQWAADRSLASNVRLVGDAEAVLAGGSRDGWGVALIAGTGSFAFGRDLQGLTIRVGGWGYLFGDEGSGHALGAAGLRAATQHADGRGPATTLLPRLLSRFDLTEPRELVTFFYGRQPARRAALAELAPLVTAAAEEGDDVAMQIASDAATDLARLVTAACSQLNLSPRRFPLAIAGGVLCNSSLMRKCLEASLAGQDHLAKEITLVEQPVQGAVELARRAIS
ncbi:MAG: BadF/BadG/BcrA/BcrD ATPase family protein [Pirellulaceae bacterium]|nr:BadF/BadG/BcrA/BcrD ATPase family protein [Pirellulaceae bacterium]MDP7303102.1 BadF/BadG/BcrA/BcrD ATPase family protein [Pirellulaceae bacterium]HJN07544.1 BadF/BadG/BcrA/BcrD ATPase family protein [Pirellulaceae bacterium]